jgi:hypothetical protein
MITIGILIALGLEQAVEVWHHHRLGVEARERIVDELRGNKRAVDNARTQVAKNKEDLQHSLSVVRLYLTRKAPARGEMRVTANGAPLSSANWTTASATGALGYMDSGDVKRFATTYEIQSLLQHAQDEMVQSAVQSYSWVAFNPGGAGDLREDQLRELERQILSCLGDAVMWDQLASQLSKQYERVLQSK